MKFAVVICSVLLIAGAQASKPVGEYHGEHHDGHHLHHHHSSWMERIERIQINIQNVIQEGLGEMIVATEAAKQRAERSEQNLKRQIGEYEANIAKQTNGLLQEVKNKIQKSAEHAGKIDVQECVELSSGLDGLAQEAIKSMTTCANKRLVKGERYIQTLIEDCNKLIFNLTSLQQEAKHCVEEADDMKSEDMKSYDWKSANHPIVCSDIAAAKTLSAIALGFPLVSADFAAVMHFRNSLPFNLDQCTLNHGYSQFAQESAQVERRVLMCIRQTIARSEHELLHEYIHHGDGHLKKPHVGGIKIAVKS